MNFKEKYIRILISCALLLATNGAVLASDLSFERKALIDQLSMAQGYQFINDNIAKSMTEEIRMYFDSANINVGEEFYEIFYDVAQEVIYEEFMLSGEVHELNYEIWGKDFSDNELRQLIEFYKTPLGAKLGQFNPEQNQLSLARSDSLNQRISSIIYYRLSQSLKDAGLDAGVLTRDSLQSSVEENQLNESELEDMRALKCSSPNNDSKRVPVHRAAPTYPYTARVFRIEGWVELGFSIKADGSTDDVKVSNASTGTLFDAEAINAVLAYVYCPSESMTQSRIRIRFEMEDKPKVEASKNGQFDSAKTAGSKNSFIRSKTFLREIENYGSYDARKSYAIADDGGDSWVSNWSYNYRTQDEANTKALTQCRISRKKHGIKSPCQTLLAGNQLRTTFSDSKALQKLVNEAHAEDYHQASMFERMLEEYNAKGQPKALALVENQRGGYQYYYVSRKDSQEQANNEAIEGCNEGKGSQFDLECKLYMAGDYLAADVPKLDRLKGLWEGSLQTRSSGLVEGVIAEEDLRIRLNNCGLYPRMYRFDSELSEFKVFGRLLQVSSQSSNVVLTSVEASQDWVETQIWSLIELDEDHATVQWNRMVSNVGLELNDENREFGYMGAGRLNKVIDGCR